jgi:tRNA modification GTPase
MKTIAAISTAPAVGGIGVIRISGDRALEIAEKVFTAFDASKKISSMRAYTAAYGFVHNRSGEKTDECVALVFHAPHSYTGEDVVELSCHGGIFLLKKVLEECFAAGAVPAEAGEFTKRAFLNKKIDLTQAEAVSAIISAQSEASAKAAISAKDGALNKKIKENTQKLTSICAHMAAWTDYPDDDIPELDSTALHTTISEVKKSCEELISRFDAGQAVTQGIDTAIVGRTNAGKSTLMNLLCGHDKSIVTDIEGTTRDIVETTVKAGNAVLKLADTAGLRESSDKIEKIGIELTKKKIESAGLILAVFDCTKQLSKDDFALLETIKSKPCVLLINKKDLSAVWEPEILRKYSDNIVFISAKNGDGYKELTQAIEKILGTQSFNPYAPMLATHRQMVCCENALKCLNDALKAIDDGFTLDAVNVCVDAALNSLLELTGDRATQKVTDEIFKKFCVGK